MFSRCSTRTGRCDVTGTPSSITFAPAKPDRTSETGMFRSSIPRSTRIMAATAVTGLVMEKSLKMWSLPSVSRFSMSA